MNLVNSVGNGVARVQFDCGEDGFSGSGSRGYNGGGGNCGGRESGITVSSITSRISGSGSNGSDRLRKLNLRGGGGDRQVGGLDTESQTVSDVVSGLDDAVGINIRVTSLDATVAVSDFVFLRVDVSITILKIAEFILSLELRRGVKGSGGHYGSGSGIGSGDGANGHNGGSGSIGSGVCSSGIGRGDGASSHDGGSSSIGSGVCSSGIGSGVCSSGIGRGDGASGHNGGSSSICSGVCSHNTMNKVVL